MPKPADLMRCLAEDAEQRALTAWLKVSDAIRRVGSYSSVAFDDPIIHAVIASQGGWIKLCSTPDHQLPFRAKAFQTHYQALCQRPLTHYPATLCGRIEQQCADPADPKHRLERPQCIGDPDLVRAVIAKGKQSALASLAITNKFDPSHQSRQSP